MTRNVLIGVGALVVIVLLVLIFGSQTSLLKTQVAPGGTTTESPQPTGGAEETAEETLLDESEECQCKCVYNKGKQNESELCEDLGVWSSVINDYRTWFAPDLPKIPEFYWCRDFIHRPLAKSEKQCTDYETLGRARCDGYFIEKDKTVNDRPDNSSKFSDGGRFKDCNVVTKTSN